LAMSQALTRRRDGAKCVLAGKADTAEDGFVAKAGSVRAVPG
jgi:hypothetical protein